MGLLGRGGKEAGELMVLFSICGIIISAAGMVYLDVRKGASVVLFLVLLMLTRYGGRGPCPTARSATITVDIYATSGNEMKQ